MKEKTFIFLQVIIIIVGLLLIIIGKQCLQGVLEEIAVSLGITLLSVFTVSLLYESLIAERHFLKFEKLFKEWMTKKDTLDSRCMRLGFDELFENELELHAKYSIKKIVESADENSIVLCIGRSLLNFLNDTQALETGLQKKIKFRLAALNPELDDPALLKLLHLQTHEVEVSLAQYHQLIENLQKRNPKLINSIELKYHRLFMPDSVLIYQTGKVSKVIWNLSFGRYPEVKKIFVFTTEQRLDQSENNPNHCSDLGSFLLCRYESIWKMDLSDKNVDLNNVSKG